MSYTAKPRAKKGKRKPDPPGVKRERGTLIKGTASLNPQGRPRGHSFLDELRTAMTTVEKEKRRTLLEQFCRRAYESDRVLCSLVDRLVPALRSMEFTGAAGDMSNEMAAAIREAMRKRFEKQ
jgi:hypothetical protein